MTVSTIDRPYRVTWINDTGRAGVLGRYSDWQMASDACDEHGAGTNVEVHIDGIGWVLDNEGVCLEPEYDV